MLSVRSVRSVRVIALMYRHVKEMKDETSQSLLMHTVRTIHMDGECEVHLKLTLYTYVRRNFVSV